MGIESGQAGDGLSGMRAHGGVVSGDKTFQIALAHQSCIFSRTFDNRWADMGDILPCLPRYKGEYIWMFLEGRLCLCTRCPGSTYCVSASIYPLAQGYRICHPCEWASPYGDQFQYPSDAGTGPVFRDSLLPVCYNSNYQR